MVLDPDLGSHQTDHAVEDNGDASENASRCRCDHRAELRTEPQQDRDDRGHVVGSRRVDAGGTHDPDVLGVRRGGRATEDAGDGGRETVGADRPAHVGVEVLAGHLGDCLHVPGVLGDQCDHAGEHEQDEGERDARTVHDVDTVGELAARETDPVGTLHGGPVPDPVVLARDAAAARERGVDGVEEPVADPREQVAEDQGQEDRDPGDEALGHDGHDDEEGGGDQGDPLVLGPVDLGHHRREVEADQHHHGAGHSRRQDLVDDAGPREVDQYADEGQHDAGDHDRAGDVGRVTGRVGPADRGDAGHERGAGAEVARHGIGHDQQEHDRADAREHDGEVGVEPHHQREHERGAEHRDHVLGPDTHGLGPRESLVRCDRLPRTRIYLLPAEHRHDASWGAGRGALGRVLVL